MRGWRSSPSVEPARPEKSALDVPAVLTNAPRRRRLALVGRTRHRRGVLPWTDGTAALPAGDVGQVMQAVGEYELLETIAEGGMATVYRGRHRPSGTCVAVKIVPPHIAGNAIMLRRFEQEYTAARAIDHPNIVKALEFGREGDTPYLVMELVEGESLGQRLERTGRLREEEAICIMVQVAEGLQQAHDVGLIHRDVKPDNILLTRDGRAKLTDLGLVKELDADLKLTRTGRGLGTPHFMAPEQFRNAKMADARCDVYSLGATLYMAVTGELPFRSNGPLDAWMKKIRNEIASVRELAPDLSERLDRTIRRAMDPEPARRPDSCRTFISELIGTIADEPTSDVAEPPAEYWRVAWTDAQGVLHARGGSATEVRGWVEEGALGAPANVSAARGPTGSFEPLSSYPEFRDLIPAATPPPSPAPVPRTPVTPKTPALAGPHIEFPTPERSLDEVWRWVALLIITVSAGVLGYFLLPDLLRGRLF